MSRSTRQVVARTLLSASLVLGSCGSGVAASELDLLVELLALAPGVQVADVGAGDGRWASELASRVGPQGHVWATEVEEDEVEKIKRRIEDQELSNITVILGTQKDTGLPASCCDAILLRLVYHHFVNPELMRQSLYRALRPGGLIAVIDIVPQKGWRRLSDVPERGGHGIPADSLVAEMADGGFEVVSTHTEWNGDADRYCIVFRRSGADDS